MRAVLTVVAAVLAAGVAVQAGVAAPGPQCGGTSWRLMTLNDAGKGVNWNPVSTTIGDIAKFTPPTRLRAARTTRFQRRVWRINDAVIERYRVASNGEIVFELYDIPSSMYMNAYITAPSCMPANKTLRRAMVGARNGFLKHCPAPTPDWQTLGAHAVIFGVGFWNPVKTTKGALPNGAELRPLVGLTITQGCGKFG